MGQADFVCIFCSWQKKKSMQLLKSTSGVGPSKGITSDTLGRDMEDDDDAELGDRDGMATLKYISKKYFWDRHRCASFDIEACCRSIALNH